MVCFPNISAIPTGTLTYDIYTTDRHCRVCFPTVCKRVFGQIGLGKQCRPRSDWIYAVCYSVYVFWTHFSIVKPRCSNFRMIKTNFSGVRIFRNFLLIKDKDNTFSLSERNETPHDKTNKMAYVPSKDSDQPGHLPSLISLRCALNG